MHRICGAVLCVRHTTTIDALLIIHYSGFGREAVYGQVFDCARYGTGARKIDP